MMENETVKKINVIWYKKHAIDLYMTSDYRFYATVINIGTTTEYTLPSSAIEVIKKRIDESLRRTFIVERDYCDGSKGSMKQVIDEPISDFLDKELAKVDAEYNRKSIKRIRLYPILSEPLYERSNC